MIIYGSTLMVKDSLILSRPTASSLRNLSPPPHIFHTCCLSPVFLPEVLCRHIDNILVKTVMFTANSYPTSLLHHYIFYFLLQDLFVFIHIAVVRQRWIVSKVVELAH